MKSKLLLSLVLILLLSGCKKKNEEVVISLKGKWTAENTIGKWYVNNVLANTYNDPVIGTTVDFQSNGTVVITEPSGSESFPYTIKSDSKVEFNGDVYEIRSLTANSVTLYIRIDYGPGDYAEFFQNMKR